MSGTTEAPPGPQPPTGARSRPTWLLRAAADVVRVGGALSFGWAIVTDQGVAAALFALVWGGLMLPRMVSVTRPPLDLAFTTILLFAAWSAVLDLYLRYEGLDVAVHAVACGLTAAVLHRILVSWSVLPGADDPLLRRAELGVVVTVTALGSALGLLWEVGEWWGHTYLDDRIQVGYGDTLGDLVAGAAGALLAGARIGLQVAGAGPMIAAPAPRPPTVSVVVPVKDDAQALERCLRLLTAQTVSPLEVVVVDNGSRDASARIATGYGARVITQLAPGIPATAGAGYDAARGDLIARCDADSMPPQDWVQRIGQIMTQHPGLDALTGNGRFYDLPRWLAPLGRGLYLGSYYVLVHAATGHTTVWGSNMVLRRRTWEEVRHLVHRDDPELHDDMDLGFALGPARSVRYDRTLVVGVSARSLRGSRQLRRRFRRAVRTLQVNWELAPPWTRWMRRLGAGRPVR